MNHVFFDIRSFGWSKENKTFYADAWTLNGEGDSFPTQANHEFFIKNTKTGGYRLFKIKERNLTHNLYESEEGLLCEIVTNDDYYYETKEETYKPEI